MDATAKREGIWIVAEFDGNRGVLARVKSKEKELNAAIRNEIAAAKIRIEMQEVYDFFCPLRPVIITDPNTGKPVLGPDGRPQQGITRDPLITGNHFMLESAPCFVNFALVSKLTFIDDMTLNDQLNYNSYIETARAKVKEQTEAIMQATKKATERIVLPADGKMPVLPDGTIDMGALTRAP